MSKSKLLLCSVFLLATLGACSDGGGDTGGTSRTNTPSQPSQDDGSSTNPSTPSTTAPSTFKLTCKASVQPAKFDYAVNGDTLTVTAPGQPGAAIQRIGSATGDKPVYGSWKIEVAPFSDPAFAKAHGLSAKAWFHIEAGRVTTTTECSSNYAKLTATASTPATITDTSIEMLETHVDSREWTPALGETVVSRQSVDFGLGAPAKAAPEQNVTISATFPGLL